MIGESIYKDKKSKYQGKTGTKKRNVKERVESLELSLQVRKTGKDVEETGDRGGVDLNLV